MVEEHSIPWMQSQSGCIAFFPGRPVDPDGLEFSMTSVWADVDAIKAAVGENWVEPIVLGDEAAIADRVEVRHYEVFGKN